MCEVSSSNSRSEPSSGSTRITSRAAGSLPFDEPSGERRREEQVVDLDGAAPSFAFFGANREQLLGAQVADDQLARFVGQQNRVGDRVDDAVEQVPLAIDAGIGGDVAQPQRLELLAQHLREPQHVVVDLGLVALEQQNAERRELRYRAAAARRRRARSRAGSRAGAARGESARAARSTRPRPADRADRRCRGRTRRCARWTSPARQCPRAGRGRSPPWRAARARRTTCCPSHSSPFCAQTDASTLPSRSSVSASLTSALIMSSVRTLARAAPPAALLRGTRSRSSRSASAINTSVGGRFERRTRRRRDLADRFGVLQIRVDRGDDDARLDRDEVDAHQRDADPGIDDDAFVQDAIENVDETCSTCCSFNGHCLLH